MRVEVDRRLCEANGLCVMQAPGVFEVTDADELRILREHLELTDLQKVDRAVHVCPKQALRLIED
jgi:ferredoxin